MYILFSCSDDGRKFKPAIEKADVYNCHFLHTRIIVLSGTNGTIQPIYWPKFDILLMLMIQEVI
jgi:hypothetical protein